MPILINWTAKLSTNCLRPSTGAVLDYLPQVSLDGIGCFLWRSNSWPKGAPHVLIQMETPVLVSRPVPPVSKVQIGS
jgi:hypothetical protein